MAKLPSELDLQRRPAPSETPGINVAQIDYSPMARGAASIGEGIQSVGKGVSAYVNAQNEVDDYDTKKKLLDFKLSSEMALEDAKREMQPGANGFSAAWRSEYLKQAQEFVGRDDANIPASQRAKIGMALKQQEVQLVERAQRYELAERDKQAISGLETTLGRTRDQVAAKPEERDRWLTEGHGLIDTSLLPVADKYRLKKEYTKQVDKAYGDALVNSIQSKEDLDKVRELIAPNMPDRREEKAALRNITPPGSDGMSIVEAGSGAKFRVHGDHADRFAGLVADLEDLGVQIKGEQSGGYANRNIAGTNIRSKHADGKAIDVNWSENAQGTRGAITDQIGADKIREIAAKNGLKWGGDFKKNPDPMHFEVNDTGAPPLTKRSITEYAGLTANDNAGAYSGPMQSLSIDERRAIYKRGEDRFRQQIGDTEKIIKEQMSVAGDGYLPPKPILDQLESRVKSLNDPLLTAQYTSMLGKAEMTQKLLKAPPQAIEDMARREREYAATNGATKEQDQAIKHLETLSASIRKQTNENPLGLAQRAQIEIPMADGPPADLEPRMRDQWKVPTQTVKLEPINFGAPDADLQLARRAEVAKGVGRYYNQPPQMFTTNERDALKDALRNGGPAMLGVLGKITKAASDSGIDPSQVMKEFTKDAPELAVVGDMVVNKADPNVLDTVSKALSWKAKLGEKFESTIDKAQAKPDLGEYADVLATQPTRVDAVKHTANLVYEYEARRQGKTQFDNELYKTVVKQVMGETKDAQGNTYGGVGVQGAGWGDGKWVSGGWFGTTPKVHVPPEIRTDKFDDMVSAIRASDLADVPRDDRNQPFPISEIRRATWISVGHGKYLLKTGTAANGMPEIMQKDGGGNYVLDVNPILQNIQKRRPDIFRGYNGTDKAAETPDPEYSFGYSAPRKTR